VTEEKREELFLKHVRELFEKSLNLFEGDIASAIAYLNRPNRCFKSGRSPLMEVWHGGRRGLRRVTNEIGRTEHGVFS